MVNLFQQASVYINDYIQYVTSDFLAGLGFGATQQLGETDGIYIGYNLDTGKNVYLMPSLAAQGVKGSVTNALAAAFPRLSRWWEVILQQSDYLLCGAVWRKSGHCRP